MISFESSGSFRNTERFFSRMKRGEILRELDRYGQMGVDALASATPLDSGETASSWGYEIQRSGKSFSISWINTHTNGSVNVAIILQYGHGTGTGGYVPGRDYINPAIRPVFDKIADGVWKAVTSA